MENRKAEETEREQDEGLSFGNTKIKKGDISNFVREGNDTTEKPLGSKGGWSDGEWLTQQGEAPQRQTEEARDKNRSEGKGPYPIFRFSDMKNPGKQ